MVVQVVTKPEGLVQYELKLNRKKTLIEAGRLFRVKHLTFGQMEVEADTESEAIAKFAERFAPNDRYNPDWFKRFSRECRTAKIRPLDN